MLSAKSIAGTQPKLGTDQSVENESQTLAKSGDTEKTQSSWLEAEGSVFSDLGYTDHKRGYIDDCYGMTDSDQGLLSRPQEMEQEVGTESQHVPRGKWVSKLNSFGWDIAETSGTDHPIQGLGTHCEVMVRS